MILIADIGGTNARFALVDDGDYRPLLERTLLCADYGSLVDAVLAYLDDVSQPMPETASLAIATPVSSDRISMTNHTWNLSVEETRLALGLKSLRVLNDYTALALALPYLDKDDYHQVGQGAAAEKQTIAVLGPGTGLGVSGAIFAGDYWLPLQSEGGHISYAPLNEHEAAVIDVIRHYCDFVSAESLVSGPGLVLLHKSIAECDGVEFEGLSPEQITARAMDGTDSSASKAVSMFCSILGNIAGNLALTLGARGGLFVGGGIVPRLGDYFVRSSFRDRFENNSKFGHYLADIPTYVITSKYPALIGSAIATRSQYSHLGISSMAGQPA